MCFIWQQSNVVLTVFDIVMKIFVVEMHHCAYMHIVCVCVCVHACVYVRMHVCVCEKENVGRCAFV